MAKPDFDPVVYVKEINGKPVERTAFTPSDDVQLRYDGWQPKGGAKNTAAAKSNDAASTKPQAK